MELELSLEIRGSRDSPFDRLPELLKLRIFARLDAKALVSASAVCKDWNAFLNNSAVRSLTLNPNLSGASSCFLLKIRYKDGDSNLDLRHGYVRVEHDGGCRAVEVLNNIVDDFRGWEVSCNGVLVSFRKWGYRHAITPPIVVCHPSLKWIKTVHLPPRASIAHNEFWGASFDPSTCHFILLIGYRQSRCFYSPYQQLVCIYIYSSKTCKWTSSCVCDRNDHSQVNPQGNGIFSQGCFFWLEKYYSDNRLVIFDFTKEQFRSMSLPKCPAHPNIGIECYRASVRYDWELRGCDGALVLVHSKSPSPRNEVVVAWRLDQNGSTWKWDIVLHRSQLIHCPYKPWFDMDKSGWWLWAEKVDFKNREDPQDLIILGEDGEEQHSIPMSLLSSRLGLPPNSYPHVDGLWVLQTITLWDSLAAL